MTVGEPFLALEWIGTVAYAVSGGAVAVRARMDWLGVAVLAVVSAIGGGTARDLLLGRVPVGWILDPWQVWVALGTAAAVIVAAYLQPGKTPARGVILVADAAGLAVFAVTGTLIALGSGVSGPVAVLIGVVSGTGGGVARDVLARQRPLILVGQIYALSAAAGATILVILDYAHAPLATARWTAVIVALGLRLLAMRYSWSLPRPPSRPPQASESAGANRDGSGLALTTDSALPSPG